MLDLILHVSKQEQECSGKVPKNREQPFPISWWFPEGPAQPQGSGPHMGSVLVDDVGTPDLRQGPGQMNSEPPGHLHEAWRSVVGAGTGRRQPHAPRDCPLIPPTAALRTGCVRWL